MATIKDIAIACNVSTATVSNIMNGKGKANQDTVKLVMKKAKELHYMPNYMAKNLKQKENKNIGIITEDLTIFHTPMVVDGIHACLEEKGYHFILGNLRMYQKYGDEFYLEEDYEKQVQNELEIVMSKQVAGIVYVEGHCHTIRCFHESLTVPMVTAHGFSDNAAIPSVVYHDMQGAYDATCSLIRRGHTRIGVIEGVSHSYHTKQRLTGYQRALFDHKILYNPSMVAKGDWGRKAGRAGAKALVSKGVTAIFAMNDLMAAGCYDYLRENDLEVGKDISVIGFDDREICEAMSPLLSTVRLPLFEIGYKATELLLEMLSNGGSIEKGKYFIDCMPIDRQSVGTIS